MKVAVTGATGLIGSALRASLVSDGIETYGITRRPDRLPAPSKGVYWDPAEGEFDSRPLERTDAVVHLAGESIAGSWTRAHKQRIRRSRLDGTRLLVEGLAKLSHPPAVLVAASAVGFYGDRGDEELEEHSPPGTGFLPELCRAWEAEVARASEHGIRTVRLRTGLVLSARGGALAPMLLLYKLGLGGPIGGGRQWVSWIHIDDLVRLYRFALENDRVKDSLNATAPEPVRQSTFAGYLGRALNRPAILPAPGFAVRMILGEMGRVLLLEGQRVLPRAARDLGFPFRYPVLDRALAAILHRGEGESPGGEHPG